MNTYEKYLDKKKFQQNIQGKQTDLFFLTNDEKNIIVAICNYGARIVGLWVKNKQNTFTNIVAGLSSIDEYLQTDQMYFGASIGPYANRISNACFIINEQTFMLDKNDGANTLHGGSQGFHQSVWDIKNVNSNEVHLSLFCADGTGGFPGNIITQIFFKLINNMLSINYKVSSDKDTQLNLTHHSFFNLNGDGKDIYDHRLTINADSFTPINKNFVSTGQIHNVINTPFDFTKSKKIGQNIFDDNEQLEIAKGYDHNFVLNKSNGKILSVAAIVEGNASSITMQLNTTEIGLQFYTGNFLSGKNILINGHKDKEKTFFCLEPQAFPNSLNEECFPNTLLKSGEVFQSEMRYYLECKQ